MSKTTQPLLLVPRPDPTSAALTQTAKILSADGLQAEANNYLVRAAEAQKAERLDNDNRAHIAAISAAAHEAARVHPDDGDDFVVADNSMARGEYIARWLIEQGWAPPPQLAFATTPRVSDEEVSLSYWLAKALGEHIDDAEGETLTETVQRLCDRVRQESADGALALYLASRAIRNHDDWDRWRTDGVVLPEGMMIRDAKGACGVIPRNKPRYWEHVAGTPDTEEGEYVYPITVVWHPEDEK